MYAGFKIKLQLLAWISRHFCQGLFFSRLSIKSTFASYVFGNGWWFQILGTPNEHICSWLFCHPLLANHRMFIHVGSYWKNQLRDICLSFPVFECRCLHRHHWFMCDENGTFYESLFFSLSATYVCVLPHQLTESAKNPLPSTWAKSFWIEILLSSLRNLENIKWI